MSESQSGVVQFSAIKKAHQIKLRQEKEQGNISLYPPSYDSSYSTQSLK